MIGITTADGRQFQCVSVTRDRLSKYLFIYINSGNIDEAIIAFRNKTSLPLVEFPEFKQFDSLSITAANDLTIRLRQET